MSATIPHKDTGLAFAGNDGQYRRKPSSFRDQISRAPGAKFPPEKGRYHLYVSYACPWATRCLITRNLKGLQDIISVNVVDWFMGEKGWRFSTPEKVPGATVDEVNHAEYIREIYFQVEPDYTGRFTVPVLYDKKLKTIVNNESSEIIRMFYTEFDDFVDAKYKGVDYAPKALLPKIDELNGWIYDDINNGVYKSGFATTQEAYEENVVKVFAALDKVEEILKHGGPYILGDTLTEVDIRLWPTIVRFDPVYVQHFKCNIQMIRYGYPHIHKWLRELYWNVPGFKEATNFDHIKFHYTKSHLKYNPFGITPLGPVPNILPL